ncbi:hypothetical protein P7K49_011798 [Saguinus oedipus]|uniref:Uncharacterized protein n=1 Tax=Saguinus oedipus TaxID=9490 RepID=A0ABQ9VRR4_SAGOE|nr:hypothetical protein P7K49_011798 [Saguinus oedipus]
MKGGGAIGPMQQGYPMAVVVPPQPAQPLFPSLDAGQLAVQQQNFINQQALILVSAGRALGLPGGGQAQQMTAQAMNLSLEQQTQQQQQRAQASEAASQAPPSAITSKPKKPPIPPEKSQHVLESEGGSRRVRRQPWSQEGVWEWGLHKWGHGQGEQVDTGKRLLTWAWGPEGWGECVTWSGWAATHFCSCQETSEETEDRPCRPKSFQQKRNYFQKMAPSTLPPPCIVKKPLKQGGAKAAKEAEAEPAKEAGIKGRSQGPAQGRGTVVRSSDPKPKRPQPSREIGNIIRMYQSRPGPVPVPVQPSRPPKAFLKKSDPKDEALAKLGINGAHLSPLMLSPGPGKGPPPAVAPRPKVPVQPGPSSSIKEKQGPLLDLFGQNLPSAQTPPPPPAPPLLPPKDPETLSVGHLRKEPHFPCAVGFAGAGAGFA